MCVCVCACMRMKNRGLEDYGSRIRRPMDLGTVLQKLQNDQYRNAHMCRLDVIQVIIITHGMIMIKY